MSIRSIVTDYLDNVVAARFKRDADGTLAFYPWGFGTGRLVTDAATEARLRLAYRRFMIGILTVAIPALSLLISTFHLTGLAFVAFLVVATAVLHALQGYLWWLSRQLPKAQERLSTMDAMMHSLDGFGTGFLVFGLVISVLFVATATLTLLFPTNAPNDDPAAMILSLLVFALMTVVYAVALWRRSNERAARRAG